MQFKMSYLSELINRKKETFDTWKSNYFSIQCKRSNNQSNICEIGNNVLFKIGFRQIILIMIRNKSDA